MSDIVERLRERLAEADEANRRVSDENAKLREALNKIVIQEHKALMYSLSVLNADRGKPKPNGDLSKWDVLAREFVQNAFEQMQKHQLEFNEELMCMIVRSEVDFELHQTVLFFPEMNCCDMRGAINFAKRTDPKVKRIVTVSGGKLDTVYYYDDDEEEPGWCVNRSFVGKGRQWQR